MTVAYLQEGTNSKKYKVTIFKPNGTRKTVQFGARGYSDYTIHKDNERKDRYIARHKPKEDWSKLGVDTAGFWARWILWSKPTVKEAIANVENKFKIDVRLSSPP